MKAFYSDNLYDFLNTDKEAIVGKLSSGYSEARYYKLISSQIEVWKDEIAILKQAFNQLRNNVDISDWHILLEYPIPRRGKRIDAVLLANPTIIILEFKIGADQYMSSDKMQVEDYCLDLRDFHAESCNRTIVPILVASKAPTLEFK